MIFEIKFECTYSVSSLTLKAIQNSFDKNSKRVRSHMSLKGPVQDRAFARQRSTF